ncbi:MAG: Sec-independent protein translocase TatB [Micrococcales bacterium]|nr:MAG: Sec-independent protein translocase TatB [Micrococcales bacterium]PIE27494.1 MAG: Sec-independent protein translocase TatB [Micrococcales bacterium]
MNLGELLVILTLIMVVVGPQRLPEYAESLARMVREVRRMAVGARDQVRAELGPDFDDIDWQKLDPRQYDPRRIVRDALTEAWEEPVKPLNANKKAPEREETENQSRNQAGDTPDPGADGDSAHHDQVAESGGGDQSPPGVASGPPATPRPPNPPREVPFDIEAT